MQPVNNKYDISKNVPDFVASYPKEEPKGYLATAYAFTKAAVTAPVTYPLNKAREVGQYLFRDQIYHASSAGFKKKLDPERLEKSRQTLRSIGGVNYTLKTPDGVLLDTMFFDVKKFREKIVQLGGQFEIQELPDGRKIPVIKVYSNELSQLLGDMRANISGYNPFNVVLTEAPWTVRIARPQKTGGIPTIDEKPEGLIILGQGNAGIYEKDRAQIFKFLSDGNSCLAINIRGTGRSTGTPTEKGTYLDYETAYKFATDYLKFPDQAITGSAYCLSSGPLTEIASKHPINLDFDRGYNKIGDIFADSAVEMVMPEQKGWKLEMVENISKPVISQLVNTFIISYDNGSKIDKVKGAICILDATKDDVIPKGSAQELRKRITSAVQSNITLEGGHCDPWDATTTENHQLFQIEKDSMRDFGRTPPLSLDERISHLGRLKYGIDGSVASGNVASKAQKSALRQSKAEE